MLRSPKGCREDSEGTPRSPQGCRKESEGIPRSPNRDSEKAEAMLTSPKGLKGSKLTPSEELRSPKGYDATPPRRPLKIHTTNARRLKKATRHPKPTV